MRQRLVTIGITLLGMAAGAGLGILVGGGMVYLIALQILHHH